MVLAARMVPAGAAKVWILSTLVEAGVVRVMNLVSSDRSGRPLLWFGTT